MNKEFVPYELAVKLKELGFDEYCFAVYFNTTQQLYFSKYINEFTIDIRTLAPLYQQAFRWFREKYGYLSYIDMDNYSFYRYTIYKGKGISEAQFETYEEAELACLEKLIEIIQGGNNE